MKRDDVGAMGKRKFRFFYDGGWTRWYIDSDDLSFLHNIAIDKMETVEEMPREQAMDLLKRFNQ